MILLWLGFAWWLWLLNKAALCNDKLNTLERWTPSGKTFLKMHLCKRWTCIKIHDLSKKSVQSACIHLAFFYGMSWEKFFPFFPSCSSKPRCAKLHITIYLVRTFRNGKCIQNGWGVMGFSNLSIDTCLLSNDIDCNLAHEFDFFTRSRQK